MRHCFQGTVPWAALLSCVLAGAAAGQSLEQAPPPCAACPEPPDPAVSLCPAPHTFFLLPPRSPWYVEADGLALRRDASGSDIELAALGTPDNVVLSTADLPADFRGGWRAMVGHTFGECFQVEGLFFSTVSGHEGASVRNLSTNDLGGTGNFFSPFTNFGQPAVAGLDYNNYVSGQFEAGLDNAEVNIRRKLPVPPGKLAVSVLFGVRYMDLPERFEYFSRSTTPLGTTSTNLVDVQTGNALVGPQIGTMFEFYIENRWWVNVEGKAALCNNRTHQRTTYTVLSDVVGNLSVEGERQEDTTAFVGDLSLTFVYRWSEHFSTRLGYQAIWVEGLALATDNFTRETSILREGPPRLNDSGSVVYHGPHAGITLSW